VNESNLARSLFTGKPKASARKKVPKNFTHIDNSQNDSLENSLDISELEPIISTDPEGVSVERDLANIQQSIEDLGDLGGTNCKEVQTEYQLNLNADLPENPKDKSPRKSSKNLADIPKENRDTSKKPRENTPRENTPRENVRDNSAAQIKGLEAEIFALKNQLQHKSQIVADLETELKKSLNAQTLIIESLKQQNHELELRLETNLATSAMLQRSLIEISALQSQPNDRLEDLESQVAELQEQILKQAGQASEYEAAIQHWKEQSLHHQRHALQLSGALDRLMDERKTSKRSTKLEKELAKQAEEMLAAIPPATIAPASEDSKVPGKVNLPSFLVRQRPALT
jgi:DNA repair exonuclease SbcCD ATPase subunit